MLLKISFFNWTPQCESNPCVNGECIDGIAAFTCTCNAGWEGQLCDVNINECESNPCVNGECIDEIAAFQCICHAGWEGTLCDVNLPNCISNQCLGDNSLLNQNDQIAIGYTKKCLTVVNKNKFKNDFKLVGKSSIKSEDCTESPSFGQSFKQVYFDPNDENIFSLCLSKYYEGPDSSSSWSPRYWCLTGKFQQVKILKAKNTEQLRGDPKWKWNYRVFVNSWPGLINIQFLDIMI